MNKKTRTAPLDQAESMVRKMLVDLLDMSKMLSSVDGSTTVRRRINAAHQAVVLLQGDLHDLVAGREHDDNTWPPTVKEIAAAMDKFDPVKLVDGNRKADQPKRRRRDL